jgi:tetratricopeptide (TPR) repeat protein
VRALLRQVDADPYRNAVRDAVLANDAKKIAELAGQTAALEQPPGFATFLGESGAISDKQRLQLLESAVSRRSGDLGLLMFLGSYPIDQKEGVDERLRWYQAAIAAAPANAAAHTNLGVALRDKGRPDDAIACHKKAIELDPKYAMAHVNLGAALRNKGRLDEAIDCYKKAIEVDPKHAGAHYNLGNLMSGKRQLDEAIAFYQKSIEFDPKHAEAHCNMGHAMASQGRFAESLASLKRGHELGSKRPDWPYPSAEWVRRAEVIAALDAKLLSFHKGNFQPNDNTERLALAGICQIKKLNHTAAGLYAAAFAADPKLVDDLQAAHRYNAACFASLAAAGQGEDAAKLDDKERTRLRQQALDWLRADLALRGKQLESGKPADRAEVQQALRDW